MALQSADRDDVFRRAFKKPETFDFLDMMLQPSRLGLGSHRFTSHEKQEDKKETEEDHEGIYDDIDNYHDSIDNYPDKPQNQDEQYVAIDDDDDDESDGDETSPEQFSAVAMDSKVEEAKAAVDSRPDEQTTTTSSLDTGDKDAKEKATEVTDT